MTAQAAMACWWRMLGVAGSRLALFFAHPARRFWEIPPAGSEFVAGVMISMAQSSRRC
jgi:hypothetical protein